MAAFTKPRQGKKEESEWIRGEGNVEKTRCIAYTFTQSTMSSRIIELIKIYILS